MEKQKKSLFGPMDLTKGTCWKTILIFSLPVILSYLLQQVYSISDAAIVGQTLTAQEVAGVNDTTSDRKSTRLNSSHREKSRMPSSA